MPYLSRRPLPLSAPAPRDEPIGTGRAIVGIGYGLTVSLLAWIVLLIAAGALFALTACGGAA